MPEHCHPYVGMHVVSACACACTHTHTHTHINRHTHTHTHTHAHTNVSTNPIQGIAFIKIYLGILVMAHDLLQTKITGITKQNKQTNKQTRYPQTVTQGV